MEKLHYIGLLLLNFTILNIFLSLLFFLISYISRKFASSMYIKSRVFFISLMVPPVVSAFTLITSFIPPVFVKPHDGHMPCLNEPYCYIFSFIPEFPMFKAALTAAAILVLISSVYSIILLGAYFRMRREINRLPELSIENNISNPPLKIIDTPLMFSFVWGYLSNIVVISAGALKALSPDELACLLAHETSHYKRRDNILKGLLLICRNTLIVFPHVHYLFRWWREEIELIGDEAAVLRTGRPMDVASAILKMQMASDTDISWNIDKFAAGFNTPVNANVLTRRIERLVAIHDSKITPVNVRLSLIPSEIGMITGLAFLFPMLFGMIYEIDPLMLHCYLEKLASVL